MSSFILKSVRSANLMNWIKTNAAGSVKGTPRDSWRAYLAANGGTGNTLHDQESTFLIAQGATGKTLRDKWAQYAAAQAGTKANEKVRSLYK